MSESNNLTTRAAHRSARRPLPKGRVYHFNVIYNHARSRLSHTADTEMSLAWTRRAVEALQLLGLVNTYYHDRDSFRGEGQVQELARVIAGSQVTVVVLSPGFVRDCWPRYWQLCCFKSLFTTQAANSQPRKDSHWTSEIVPVHSTSRKSVPGLASLPADGRVMCSPSSRVAVDGARQKVVLVGLDLREDDLPAELRGQHVFFFTSDWQRDQGTWSRVEGYLLGLVDNYLTQTLLDDESRRFHVTSTISLPSPQRPLQQKVGPGILPALHSPTNHWETLQHSPGHLNTPKGPLQQTPVAFGVNGSDVIGNSSDVRSHPGCHHDYLPGDSNCRKERTSLALAFNHKGKEPGEAPNKDNAELEKTNSPDFPDSAQLLEPPGHWSQGPPIHFGERLTGNRIATNRKQIPVDAYDRELMQYRRKESTLENRSGSESTQTNVVNLISETQSRVLNPTDQSQSAAVRLTSRGAWKTAINPFIQSQSIGINSSRHSQSITVGLHSNTQFQSIEVLPTTGSQSSDENPSKESQLSKTGQNSDLSEGIVGELSSHLPVQGSSLHKESFKPCVKTKDSSVKKNAISQISTPMNYMNICENANKHIMQISDASISGLVKTEGTQACDTYVSGCAKNMQEIEDEARDALSHKRRGDDVESAVLDRLGQAGMRRECLQNISFPRALLKGNTVPTDTLYTAAPHAVMSDTRNLVGENCHLFWSRSNVTSDWKPLSNAEGNFAELKINTNDNLSSESCENIEVSSELPDNKTGLVPTPKKSPEHSRTSETPQNTSALNHSNNKEKDDFSIISENPRTYHSPRTTNLLNRESQSAGISTSLNTTECQSVGITSLNNTECHFASMNNTECHSVGITSLNNTECHSASLNNNTECQSAEITSLNNTECYSASLNNTECYSASLNNTECQSDGMTTSLNIIGYQSASLNNTECQSAGITSLNNPAAIWVDARHPCQSSQDPQDVSISHSEASSASNSDDVASSVMPKTVKTSPDSEDTSELKGEVAEELRPGKELLSERDPFTIEVHQEDDLPIFGTNILNSASFGTRSGNLNTKSDKASEISLTDQHLNCKTKVAEIPRGDCHIASADKVPSDERQIISVEKKSDDNCHIASIEEKPSDDRHIASIEEKPSDDRHTASVEEKPCEVRHIASVEEKPCDDRHVASVDENPSDDRHIASVEEKPSDVKSEENYHAISLEEKTSDDDPITCVVKKSGKSCHIPFSIKEQWPSREGFSDWSEEPRMDTYITLGRENTPEDCFTKSVEKKPSDYHCCITSLDQHDGDYMTPSLMTSVHNTTSSSNLDDTSASNMDSGFHSIGLSSSGDLYLAQVNIGVLDDCVDESEEQSSQDNDSLTQASSKCEQNAVRHMDREAVELEALRVFDEQRTSPEETLRSAFSSFVDGTLAREEAASDSHSASLFLMLDTFQPSQCLSHTASKPLASSSEEMSAAPGFTSHGGTPLTTDISLTSAPSVDNKVTTDCDLQVALNIRPAHDTDVASSEDSCQYGHESESRLALIQMLLRIICYAMSRAEMPYF